MDYNKTTHLILGQLSEVRLNYIEEYHVINESFLTIDQIVKKNQLNYGVVKIVLASLQANEEIKLFNSQNDFDSSGYRITNKGMQAYGDKKYPRLKIERLRATWSFYFSIASLIVSIIAIFIAAWE
ncbi:hypothetical protein [Flavobacterium soyae]|uniref:Uncharacterized protein n=1 Tax=Flavobacterium soyae TaxID=2903098 RepID=A0ABZ2UG13_9FLAO